MLFVRVVTLLGFIRGFAECSLPKDDGFLNSNATLRTLSSDQTESENDSKAGDDFSGSGSSNSEIESSEAIQNSDEVSNLVGEFVYLCTPRDVFVANHELDCVVDIASATGDVLSTEAPVPGDLPTRVSIRRMDRDEDEESLKLSTNSFYLRRTMIALQMVNFLACAYRLYNILGAAAAIFREYGYHGGLFLIWSATVIFSMYTFDGNTFSPDFTGTFLCCLIIRFMIDASLCRGLHGENTDVAVYEMEFSSSNSSYMLLLAEISSIVSVLMRVHSPHWWLFSVASFVFVLWVIRDIHVLGHVNNAIVTDGEIRNARFLISVVRAANAYSPPSLEVIERNPQCSVCLCPLDANDRSLSMLACGHVFHRKCLFKWVQQQMGYTCPNCRIPYVEDAGQWPEN